MEKPQLPSDLADMVAPSSVQDSDLLMKDPCLDYINDMLMEEGDDGDGDDDDASCMQQVHAASYQRIFSGFCEILGEHLPPIGNSSIHADHVVDPHFLHQSMHHHREDGSDEYRIDLASPNVELSGFAGELHNPGPPIAASLPAHDHQLHSSFHKEGTEAGIPSKHGSGFQSHLMGNSNPLKFTQITRFCDVQKYMHKSGSHLSSCGLSKTSVSLSSRNNIASQFCSNAVTLNDGEPLNAAMVSHDAVEGPGGHRGMARGQQLGDFNVKLPSADEGVSLMLADIGLSFEDLKLNDAYINLYIEGQPSFAAGSSTRAASDSKHTSGKKKFMPGKGCGSGQRSTPPVHMCLDSREVLLECAKAVAIGDVRRASKILQELRQSSGSSADGTGLQRVTHFFSEALTVRLRGMGEQCFREICDNLPSTVTLLQILRMEYELTPIVKLVHYFANQSIVKVAEGASRLHVVDFGILYGVQWPCLINALADRPGGPPLLVITGIELSKRGTNPAERLGQTGQRLAAYAKMYNVPFQFYAIVSDKWEELDAASLHIHEGEVLVVNCIKCLRHLHDETIGLPSAISPRQKFFTRMCSLNPHLLLTAVVNAAYNSPFFASRFRDALYFFSNLFDMLEVVWGDHPKRVIMERTYLYRDIINIVACEGSERVERPETYKQWQEHITKAGFEQLPISPTILSRSKSHAKQHYHKDFLVHDDANIWMLMGWKGRARLAIAAWKPSLRWTSEGHCRMK